MLAKDVEDGVVYGPPANWALRVDAAFGVWEGEMGGMSVGEGVRGAVDGRSVVIGVEGSRPRELERSGEAVNEEEEETSQSAGVHYGGLW